MRRHLVLEESNFPTELTNIFKNLENSGNPWGIAPDDRELWATGMNVPKIRDAEIPPARIIDRRLRPFVRLIDETVLFHRS